MTFQVIVNDHLERAKSDSSISLFKEHEKEITTYKTQIQNSLLKITVERGVFTQRIIYTITATNKTIR